MSEPRHVVLLTTDFRPMTGGVADHLHRLADSLASYGPVTVVTSAAQNATRWPHAYDLELLEPLPERRLGQRIGDAWPLVRKLHTGAHFAALRRYAGRTLRRVKTVAPSNPVPMIGIWDTAAHFWCGACRRAGLPYYLFAHGAEVIAPLYGRLPAWRAGDFAHAVRIIANSRATADLVSGRFALPSPPAVVHPAVGARPAASVIAGRAAMLRVELGVGAGPVVLTLGRLVPRKGSDLVVRSVAELRSDRPDLMCIIAGEGPERAALESLVASSGLSEHVRFLGKVDEITKWALYELCDVFVMPNRDLDGRDWEGFGIVFLEAALAERPSIGGRTGGTADAIVDGVTGLLVDPEQPGQLTSAIRQLVQDPTLRTRLGLAAAERARMHFSGSAMVAALRSELRWT